MKQQLGLDQAKARSLALHTGPSHRLLRLTHLGLLRLTHLGYLLLLSQARYCGAGSEADQPGDELVLWYDMKLLEVVGNLAHFATTLAPRICFLSEDKWRELQTSGSESSIIPVNLCGRMWRW